MQTLTLDYVLEGRQRGYQFTSPTTGIPPDMLKRIWRSAMPRGKAWGDPRFRGASSLKCFTLDESGKGRVAACEVSGTDQVDELGRTGIRRARIHIFTFEQHAAYLAARLEAVPAAITQEAERKLRSRDWELLFRKHSDARRPATLWKPQTILVSEYTPEKWQFVEACLLLLVTRSTFLTNLIELTPKFNPFADKALAFTTLALDPDDDGRLIALPADRAAHLNGIPLIRID